jgi:hypothetical protein
MGVAEESGRERDSRVFFHEAFTFVIQMRRGLGGRGEEETVRIETWPRWDKRYSIESKLCYSSLSPVDLYSSREMVLNGVALLASTSTILFCSPPASHPHTHTHTSPYILETGPAQYSSLCSTFYTHNILRRLPSLLCLSTETSPSSTNMSSFWVGGGSPVNIFIILRGGFSRHCHS